MTQTPVMSEFEATTVVAAVTEVADDVVSIRLAAEDGSSLPAWRPGAHIDLVLTDASGEELTRQYSLCGSPADDRHYEVAVLRTPDSRGGSAAVHALKVGDQVRIRGPRNHFPLVRHPKYLFIAGGIGITPMLPMIEEAEASGIPWELHYGGRTTSSMAFLDRLKEYGDRVVPVPQDTDGILDLNALLGTPVTGVGVYCCGPEPLLAAVEDKCRSWLPGSLHLERFSAKAAADDSADTAFDLVLQRSGLTVRVEPGTTVFDAMRAAGVSVLGSCLEGICGTCEQGVLEGEVDHRDSVLDEDEQAANDCMMVCVSRSLSDQLVLDA